MGATCEIFPIFVSMHINHFVQLHILLLGSFLRPPLASTTSLSSGFPAAITHLQARLCVGNLHHHLLSVKHFHVLGLLGQSRNADFAHRHFPFRHHCPEAVLEVGTELDAATVLD